MFSILTKPLFAIAKHIPRSDPAVTRCLAGLIASSPQHIARTMTSKCLVAVCQHTSKENKDDNYREFERQITGASRAGCKLAFLPECFDFVCDSKQQAYEQAESIDGPLIGKYRKLATDLKIWLFLGGMHEKRAENPPDKVSNAHIVIDERGQIVRVYRKMHLFNLDVPGTRLLESNYTVSGDQIEPLVSTPAGQVGLGICYDLRFPEFAISMAKAGATILTYPSSFTVKTGLAHWEPLIRTRAIENQCYVVAAAQTGIQSAKRSAYGHAMIVDPWGHVIGQCGDKSGFAIGEIDLEYLADVRMRLPIWTDRKPHAYGYIIPASTDQSRIDDQPEYKFGQVSVKSSQVFFRTNYSYAFVNHRPVLPGHVLVSSLREVKKFTELTSDEVADLFNSVQKVQRVIEKDKQANSSTICIQDGIDAGQSIEHVHVHLLPRRSDDFDGNMDKVYEELRSHDKKSGPVLSDDLMAEQAARLRRLMNAS